MQIRSVKCRPQTAGTKVRMQTEVKTAEKQKSFYMYPVYPSAWTVNRKIVDKLFVTCPGWPQLLFQPQKQQNLLFSSFADFRKAFDRNNTATELFDELRKESVQRCFLESHVWVDTGPKHI